MLNYLEDLLFFFLSSDDLISSLSEQLSDSEEEVVKNLRRLQNLKRLFLKTEMFKKIENRVKKDISKEGLRMP